MRQDQELRICELKSLSFLVPFFYSMGEITKEDFERWVLDDSGKFIPELIKVKQNDE